MEQCTSLLEGGFLSNSRTKSMQPPKREQPREGALVFHETPLEVGEGSWSKSLASRSHPFSPSQRGSDRFGTGLGSGERRPWTSEEKGAERWNQNRAPEVQLGGATWDAHFDLIGR